MMDQFVPIVRERSCIDGAVSELQNATDAATAITHLMP